MRRVIEFTTTSVVFISVLSLCHAFDISTFEAEQNDVDFDFNEIDFESAFIAANGTNEPIDKNIEEDSKLDTVRV